VSNNKFTGKKEKQLLRLKFYTKICPSEKKAGNEKNKREGWKDWWGGGEGC